MKNMNTGETYQYSTVDGPKKYEVDRKWWMSNKKQLFKKKYGGPVLSPSFNVWDINKPL